MAFQKRNPDGATRPHKSSEHLDREVLSAIRNRGATGADRDSVALRRKLEIDDIGRLPRLTNSYSNEDHELVRGYVLLYLSQGNVEAAAKIIMRTGVNINWEEESEAVNKSYTTIAATFVLRSGKQSVKANLTAFDSVHMLQELTGIAIPGEIKDYLLDVISKVSRPSNIVTAIKAYSRVIGGSIPADVTERIARAAWIPGYEGKRRVSAVYELAGIPDSAKAMEIINELSDRDAQTKANYRRDSNANEVQRRRCLQAIQELIFSLIKNSDSDRQYAQELLDFVDQSFSRLSSVSQTTLNLLFGIDTDQGARSSFSSLIVKHPLPGLALSRSTTARLLGVSETAINDLERVALQRILKDIKRKYVYV